MSRVERVDSPNERRGTEQRQAERGRIANRRSDSPGRTPGKAEGEVGDVEEALKRGEEEN